MGIFSSSPMTPQALNKKISDFLDDGADGRAERLLDNPELDLNVFSVAEDCPLRMAVRRGSVKMVELLIQKGADIARADMDPDYPLIYLAASANFGVAKALISKGLDVNTVAYDGNTPLHRAAETGYASVVRLLLDNGADPNIMNDNLGTAADLADARYPRIADFIRNHKSFRRVDIPAEWAVTADQEITHVYEKKSVGLIVTDIFDFRRRSYMNIVFNDRAKTQSHVTKSFAELAETGLVEEAAAEMKKRGVDVTPTAGFHFSN